MIVYATTFKSFNEFSRHSAYYDRKISKNRHIDCADRNRFRECISTSSILEFYNYDPYLYGDTKHNEYTEIDFSEIS